MTRLAHGVSRAAAARRSHQRLRSAARYIVSAEGHLAAWRFVLLAMLEESAASEPLRPSPRAFRSVASEALRVDVFTQQISALLDLTRILDVACDVVRAGCELFATAAAIPRWACSTAPRFTEEIGHELQRYAVEFKSVSCFGWRTAPPLRAFPRLVAEPSSRFCTISVLGAVHVIPPRDFTARAHRATWCPRYISDTACQWPGFVYEFNCNRMAELAVVAENTRARTPLFADKRECWIDCLPTRDRRDVEECEFVGDVHNSPRPHRRTCQCRRRVGRCRAVIRMRRGGAVVQPVRRGRPLPRDRVADVEVSGG